MSVNLCLVALIQLGATTIAVYSAYTESKYLILFRKPYWKSMYMLTAHIAYTPQTVLWWLHKSYIPSSATALYITISDFSVCVLERLFYQLLPFNHSNCSCYQNHAHILFYFFRKLHRTLNLLLPEFHWLIRLAISLLLGI